MAALGAVASLWRVYELDMTRNYTLVSLLLSILVYSVATVIYYAHHAAGSFNNVANTINSAAGMTAHWIITQAYLGVVFDTRMLVNIKTYLDDPEKMKQVDRFRLGMIVANIVAFLLIVAIIVCGFIVGENYGKLYFIAAYSY